LFQLLSFEFLLYMKPGENFSRVITVYTTNATELIQRVIMQLLNALLLYGLEAANPNERTLTRIITAWNSVIRKVCNIKYEACNYVSSS